MIPYARIHVLLLLLTGAVFAPGARAQEAETFNDWKVECAGTLCVASTVTPGGSVSLRILREPGPERRWEIGFAGVQDDIEEGMPVEVSVDGARPIRFAEDGYATDGGRLTLTAPELTPRLFVTLLRGNTATLAFTHKSGAPLRLDFSLAGLSAATRWIEENQERETAQSQPSGPPEGAPDHVPAPGEESPDRAQAPEAPPTEDAEKAPPPEEADRDAPSGQAEKAAPAEEAGNADQPAEVPEVVSERHLEDGVCKDYEAEAMRAARIADKLDDHHSVYVLPCYTGAYNVVYRVWITDRREPDEVERALFAVYSDEQGWTGTDQIVNADYDPETKSLTAFDKGRGVGDCGSAPTWRWHQSNWRLMEYRYQSECDGTTKPEDWPVIFEHPEK